MTARNNEVGFALPGLRDDLFRGFTVSYTISRLAECRRIGRYQLLKSMFDRLTLFAGGPAGLCEDV